MRWYQKAAEQGHADAQFNPGVAYENGRGVKYDYAEAVRWYQKAAEQGLVYAVSALKRLFVGVVTSNASPSTPKAKLQRLDACAATVESAREVAMLPSRPAHGARSLCMREGVPGPALEGGRSQGGL